jgi:CubicO group peptidase (beta-lactamase class C family)
MKSALNKQFVIFTFLLFPIFQLKAQTESRFLKIGKPVVSGILVKEKHLYKIKLEKEHFAFFRVKQKGVDVLITTYNPQGRKIKEFDSPNGANGDEFVTIHSSQKGDYRLEIQTLEETPKAGTYELSLEKIKSNAVKPSQKIDELLAKYDFPDVPGVAVSVIKDGEFIYKKGFGIANLEYGIPVTPATAFHVASVSKQFTIFSILLLEKEGKLSLDDDIRKYLPELPEFGQPITIKNLANHTSGIRDNSDLAAINGLGENDSITNEQILKLITRQKAINFVPGSEFEYCNSGFILLAQIVARVSGKKFSEFAAERIFKPLKMNDSSFLDDNQKVVRNLAYAYSPEGNSYRKTLLNYSIVGSTGLVTTIEDLSLWAMNFEKPAIGDASIFNQMAERSMLNDGEKISYGLGQENKKYRGLDIIFHGGGIAGYRSYLLRIPARKFSVVIMSNSQAFNPLEVADRIIDFFLDDTPQTSETPKNNQAIKIKKETLEAYTGNFEIMPGVIFSITKEAETLYLQGNGEEKKTALRAISENEFLLSDEYNRISFQKLKDEPGYSLQFFIYDFRYKGKRISINPSDETRVNSVEFGGTYYSEELGTTYTIVVTGNKLIATHNRNEDIPLTAFQTDVFITGQWFFRKVQFMRDGNFKISGFKVSGARARAIEFHKLK